MLEGWNMVSCCSVYSSWSRKASQVEPGVRMVLRSEQPGHVQANEMEIVVLSPHFMYVSCKEVTSPVIDKYSRMRLSGGRYLVLYTSKSWVSGKVNRILDY